MFDSQESQIDLENLMQRLEIDQKEKRVAPNADSQSDDPTKLNPKESCQLVAHEMEARDWPSSTTPLEKNESAHKALVWPDSVIAQRLKTLQK